MPFNLPVNDVFVGKIPQGIFDGFPGLANLPGFLR